ncbi:integrin beta-2 [Erpetoichthys calabaricus]|uniref:Integrin beta n=1 Tax=Erpetoichthys calabaricus TaxID=27687 RepID=A0A8C4XHN2_ERPCA|nr:integrin beta-2 [Erpetoichthys calabaricus]XP_051787170.1 integrin beta-2 [Erpetoichthys calabaricus]
MWFLLFTLLLLDREAVLSQECTKTNVKNCNDCMVSGPNCAWCKQKNFTKHGEPDSTRCDTEQQLLNRGCKKGNIIDYNSVFAIIQNNPITQGETPTQLAPQRIRLNLRPGKPSTFTVYFKRAEGYPVDLYYLMDLSYSMKDDLLNVKTLGSKILDALNSITKNSRIGFGSFVDKTVLPYTNTHPDKLKKPCPESETFCQPAFGYQHVLDLTDNEENFKNEVSRQAISGNLDAPEGGLDAIMQATVCEKDIGWRNNTRLLVYASDDGFHFAGDGKLAAILTPNDGQCHMVNKRYSKSNEMDYPSVGQVAQKLQQNNIQPIFAVTENMYPVYEELSQMIPKSAVGKLSNDSSNVVTLIKDAYNDLSSTVILEHRSLPEGLKISYNSKCSGGGTNEDKGRCTNVKINKEISFDVTVTAEKCISEQSFEISVLGFTEKIIVETQPRCTCNCDEVHDPTDCSGSGKITCGICSCKEGFVGQNCECRLGEKSEKDLVRLCQRDNSSIICSGLGDCVCGFCQCHSGDTEGKKIYGKYCECDNKNCELNNGQICGGKGQCDCGKCHCLEGYEGSACQCKKSEEGCRNSRNSVCSGRGTCECNTCKCKDGYQQPFCEECPACQLPCVEYAQCAECHLQENGNPEDCKSKCLMSSAIVTERLVSAECKHKDSKGCMIFFNMRQLDGDNIYYIEVSRHKECVEPPSISAIVGGTVAGVALIGLLLLLLWKAVTHYQDLKEFRKFEKEKQKAKWNNADNPLFTSATTTVMNPRFTGDGK